MRWRRADMLDQILAVTGTSLRSIPERWGASLVVVLGIAGVVGVMVSVLAMAEGFDRTFASAGRSDRVVVLRNGETTGTASAISREQVPLIMDAPGLARGADGKPLASVEKVVIATLPEKATGNEANVVIRGVSEQAYKVRPEVKIVEGRAFTPGLRELIVGRGAHGQFAGLELGAEVTLNGTAWTLVGFFETGGTVHESELWGDVDLVLAAYSQTGLYAAITAMLQSEDSFTTYKDALTTNPALTHYPQRETEYYEAQSARLGGMMRGFGYGVAVIMALGALFSAVNTMYAAVKARTVEIATLRAIGFRGTPIVISVLLEAVALCAAGGVLGGALAWAVFNGYSVSTLNQGTFTQVAFNFYVSERLLLQGLAWSCAIGLLGALLPAVRAARLPVVDALRAA
jgi:putative ABC transport system permease protein